MFTHRCGSFSKSAKPFRTRRSIIVGGPNHPFSGSRCSESRTSFDPPEWPASPHFRRQNRPESIDAGPPGPLICGKPSGHLGGLPSKPTIATSQNRPSNRIAPNRSPLHTWHSCVRYGPFSAPFPRKGIRTHILARIASEGRFRGFSHVVYPYFQF